MSKLAELLEQRAKLDEQIAEVRARERDDAIQRARFLAAEFGLLPADIFGRGSGRSSPAKKVAPKYRDPETGQTWSGRGREPKWIAGKDRSLYAL